MSVFQVRLNNTQQGQLDLDPSHASTLLVGNPANTLGPEMGLPGSAFPYTSFAATSGSVQRTIFVAGPHRIYRELFDGQIFTDCNYWKRFAFPQVPLDQAFITVLVDDGSIYSDFSEENTFPLVFSRNVLTTDTFATNYIDILGVYGSYANFVQIHNLGTVAINQDIKVELNGSASAIINLLAGDTQVFNAGDLKLSKLAFQLGGGGTPATTPIEVILAVEAPCNT